MELPTLMTYRFNTKNLYNKYTLEKFLYQYNILSGDTIYIDYSANTTSVGYNPSVNYINCQFINSGDTNYFMGYTSVIVRTNLDNVYKRFLGEISGTSFIILEPNFLNIGEIVTEISNLYTVKEISDTLYECYINTDSDSYKKLDIGIIKKIYNSYYHIINDLDVNSELRDTITGFLFENENSVFVLKIYNPQDIKDVRLLYNPIESTILGKNKKTTVPFKVDSVRPIQFNVIDENIYSEFVFDSNIYNNVVICDNGEMILTYPNPGTVQYGSPIPIANSTVDGYFTYDKSGYNTPTGTTTVTAIFHPTNILIYPNGLMVSVTYMIEKVTLYVSGSTTTTSGSTPTRLYKQFNPTFNVQYSGFITGEDENNLITKPTSTCSADINSNIGTYYIIPSGGVSNNYTFEYYNGVLTINKAITRIVWTNPSPIIDTTPLSSTQLNAYINTDDVSNGATGSTVYTPSGGTLLSIGPHTLSMSLTSTNPNWSDATASVDITVNATIVKNTPNLQWSVVNPTIVYGTSIPNLIYYAQCITPYPPYTLTYSPTGVLPTGTTTVTAQFHLTYPSSDSSTWNDSGTTDCIFNVTKIPVTFTFGSLSQAYTGSLLSPSITSSPSVSPLVISSIPTPSTNAGSYTYYVSYTDATYDGSGSTSFTITKQVVTVTVTNGSVVYNGSTHTASITTSYGTPVVTYNGSPTLPVNAGVYSVVATVDDSNHHGTGTGTLQITAANPSLSYPGSLSPIWVDTPLTSTQLCATHVSSGYFTYRVNSSIGAIVTIGNHLPVGHPITLYAVFTSTDPNYVSNTYVTNTIDVSVTTLTTDIAYIDFDWFGNLCPSSPSDEINISTNSSNYWTITNSNSWLTVMPASGTGSGTITITVSSGSINRSGTIYINSSAPQVPISISRSQLCNF